MKTTLKYFRTALLTGIVAMALGMPLAYADEGKMNSGNPCAGKSANPCAPATGKKMEKKKMKKKHKNEAASNPCAGKNPCAPKAANPGAK